MEVICKFQQLICKEISSFSNRLPYSLVCTEQIERSVPYTENGTVFISETSYYPPHITAPVRLAEKLVNDYLAGGGEELERDKDGNVIWSQENFMARI